MVKRYIEKDPVSGFPRGVGIYYECQKCGRVLDSMSRENVRCDCSNIVVDVDAGRLGIQDNSLVKALRYGEDLNGR